MQEQTEVKRGRGRPRKYEKVVRAKDDPLQEWRADQALAKAKGDPLVALAVKQLPNGMQIPKGLDRVTEKHFVLLVKDFTELGIDVVRYKLVTVQLAKHFAFEEACEKELAKIGGIAYKVSGDKNNLS